MFMCENNFPQNCIQIDALMDPKDLEEQELVD